MTKIYYFDTCIWRDFYESRSSKSGKPFGRYAAELIRKIVKEHSRIIFSDVLIWELRKAYSEEDILEMLNFLFICGVLVKIDIKREEYQEAKKLSLVRDIPLVDCLQSIQARNHNTVLVSQDEHIIKGLSDITKAVKPQKII